MLGAVHVPRHGRTDLLDCPVPSPLGAITAVGRVWLCFIFEWVRSHAPRHCWPPVYCSSEVLYSSVSWSCGPRRVLLECWASLLCMVDAPNHSQSLRLPIPRPPPPPSQSPGWEGGQSFAPKVHSAKCAEE